MTTVRALKNFGYPGDPAVRKAIRTFHQAKKNEGRSWDGDRGKRIEVTAGDVFEAPEDLLDGWLAAGIVTVLEAVEGVSPNG